MEECCLFYVVIAPTKDISGSESKKVVSNCRISQEKILLLSMSSLVTLQSRWFEFPMLRDVLENLFKDGFDGFHTKD